MGPLIYFIALTSALVVGSTVRSSNGLKARAFMDVPAGIPPIILNELAEEISYPLANFFQASLESGRLSKDWLTGNVSPIYKGCQRVDPKNFRPVSQTSTCSKVLERSIKFALI